MKLPTSLKYVKLKDYQKFTLIKNPNTEDLIKCVTGINSSDLAKLKSTKFDKLELEVNNLFDNDYKLINQFTIYGTTYGFIPNLDEITYGENKDITAYINDWGNMHKAMAVMYRPLRTKFGSQYTIEQYHGSHVYSEIMKDMPLDVVLGSIGFFYSLTNELLSYIPKFLENQTKEMETIKAVSPRSGILMESCTLLLKETLQDLKKLQNFPYTNA